MIDDQKQLVRRKRGRPVGTVKSPVHCLSDRVRTRYTLIELFLRVGNADNVNQFASWFDSALRRLHPGRPWETAENNKWRKNFSGNSALTADSIGWLTELFPDAKLLFDCGPKRLWMTLWGPASSPDGLWDIYGDSDAPLGLARNDLDALEALQIKVYGSVDFNTPLDEKDLGWAIMLKRLHEQFGMGTPDDEVELYLCVKAALAYAGIGCSAYGVFHEIAEHLAAQELRRAEADSIYQEAVRRRWAGNREVGEWDLLEYVENPFLRMAERASTQNLADRWWSLAALTHDNYRRSKDGARKSIRAC